jgi:MFS family permease
MQSVTPVAIRYLRSHKRWVIACATVQALTFVPLVLTALLGRISGPGLLLVAAVYWGTGLATGPAWNTWIGTLVPAAIRARFFAFRTRASQAAVFLGFLLGGLALQFSAAHHRALPAFAAIFVLAGSCRLISVWMLSRQSEPMPIPPNMRELPWRDMWHQLRAHSGGQLLVYLVAVQAAVQMAVPYFAPFMLKKLEFSYGAYVSLMSVAFLSKVVALPICGHVAHRLGARRLLWIGGIGITPLSAGWLVSQHFAWLMFLQIAGGIAWGAYELAFFLLFFESIPAQERTSMLTLYNLINTAAWVTGSLAGGLVLVAGATSFTAYLLIFGLSGVGRVLALPLLARVVPEDVEAAAFGVRTVAVRPNSASLDVPILPSLPDQVHGAEESSAGATPFETFGGSAHQAAD